MRRTAFTVVELLVVISIIILLIALLLPAIGNAREVGRRAVCASNQRQIATGSTSYANDHNGVLPVFETWAMHFVTSNPGVVVDPRDLLIEIGGSPDTYYCPSHKELRRDDPVYGWDSVNPNRYMSYGPIGIWQQSTTAVSWPKTYTAYPQVDPTLPRQGNRPVRLSEAEPDMAVSTDSQISWYAGTWGISFTYPGDGVWPNDPGYYAYLSYPHREGDNSWAGTNAAFFDGSSQWRNFDQIFDDGAPYPHGAKWIMHYQRGVYEGAVFW